MERITPAMRLLLSDLPSDSQARPSVREVKSTHTSQFYRLECAGAAFACPALPYKVAFDYARIYPNAKVDVPKAVRDPHALAAYVDLLQTAEYALPAGSEEDWTDPLKSSLWKRVTLGGRYLLGKENKPVNILIKLNTVTNGYAVEECVIATDEDYEKFTTQVSAWKRILAEYYDIFDNN